MRAAALTGRKGLGARLLARARHTPHSPSPQSKRTVTLSQPSCPQRQGEAIPTSASFHLVPLPSPPTCHPPTHISRKDLSTAVLPHPLHPLELSSDWLRHPTQVAGHYKLGQTLAPSLDHRRMVTATSKRPRVARGWSSHWAGKGVPGELGAPQSEGAGWE